MAAFPPPSASAGDDAGAVEDVAVEDDAGEGTADDAGEGSGDDAGEPSTDAVMPAGEMGCAAGPVGSPRHGASLAAALVAGVIASRRRRRVARA